MTDSVFKLLESNVQDKHTILTISGECCKYNYGKLHSRKGAPSLAWNNDLFSCSQPTLESSLTSNLTTNLSIFAILLYLYS